MTVTSATAALAGMPHFTILAAGSDSLVPKLHPWIHLIHFIGLCMLLSLPISALILRQDMAGDDMTVVARLAGVLGRMDRVALAGAIILLVSGFAQMWAHHITFGDAFSSDQPWLGVKLVLFLALLLNGYFFAGPAIRARVNLLQGLQGRMRDQLTSEEQTNLRSSYVRMQVTGIPMMVLILTILVVVLFQPFTAHPR